MFRRLFKSLVLEPQVDDDIEEIARFQIPENAAILRSTGAYAPTYSRTQSVRRIEGKHAIMRRIDGHPDMHNYLWDRAGAEIPRKCCWVIQAKAAFANPDTNIIFAVAGGMHDLRIRISDRCVPSLSDYDTDPFADDPAFRWIRSRLKLDDDRAMLAMAYSDSMAARNQTEQLLEPEPPPESN